MADNIDVEPSGHHDRVSVATDEIDKIHYPIYKMATGADGEVELVDSDSPLPIESTQLVLEMRQTQQLLEQILVNSRLQTEMLKEAFNSTLTERDIS